MQLQGRNFAHIGCLSGLVLGLSGGLVLAWVLILHNVASLLALGFWGVLSIGLAVVGYIVGNRLSDSPPPKILE